MSGLERRRLRDNLIPLCSSLRRGHGVGRADLMGMLVSKQGQGRFRMDIRKCFFIEYVIKYCTGCLERRLMPQTVSV